MSRPLKKILKKLIVLLSFEFLILKLTIIYFLNHNIYNDKTITTHDHLCPSAASNPIPSWKFLPPVMCFKWGTIVVDIPLPLSYYWKGKRTKRELKPSPLSIMEGSGSYHLPKWDGCMWDLVPRIHVITVWKYHWLDPTKYVFLFDTFTKKEKEKETISEKNSKRTLKLLKISQIYHPLIY